MVRLLKALEADIQTRRPLPPEEEAGQDPEDFPPLEERDDDMEDLEQSSKRQKSAPGSVVFSSDHGVVRNAHVWCQGAPFYCGSCPAQHWRRLERSLLRGKEGKSCDQARVRNDQERCTLALTRSRAERKGLYDLEGKESGSRFVPGFKLPNRVPGFSSAVQVSRDVLVKQSTSHPDFPGETPLNSRQWCCEEHFRQRWCQACVH